MADSLRKTKRIAMMKDVQRTALRLFRKHSFDGTTVEQIARDAGVGTATVYRHFDTKEGIVLWDEYDGGFAEEMAELISSRGVAAALKALCSEFDHGMDKEQIQRHKTRMRLVKSEPALQRQSLANGAEIASLVATSLAAHQGRKRPAPSDNAIGFMVAGLFHSLMMDWAHAASGKQRFSELMKDAVSAFERDVLAH